MAASTANVLNLGPVTVAFNSVDIGHVNGVEITIVEKTNEHKIDMYGDAAVAAFEGGLTIEAKMLMQETDYTALAAASHQITKITGTTTTGTKLAGGAAAGAQITGQLLTLTPLDTNNSKSTTKIFAIYKAYVATCNKKIAISPEKACEYEVVFRGLIDETRTAGDRLFGFGQYLAIV